MHVPSDSDVSWATVVSSSARAIVSSPASRVAFGVGLRDLVLGVLEPARPLLELALARRRSAVGRGILGAAIRCAMLGIALAASSSRVARFERGSSSAWNSSRSRADLLFEVGLPLDELGSVRCAETLCELCLGGAELVLEHRRALFLGSQRPNFGPKVVELLRLRR